MAEYKKIESALIHGGIYGDKRTGAVNVPIFQTSTFEQLELGKHTGYEYSRTGNPTREALEALIAELEKGKAGFAFGSGMAAITAVLSLFHTGDRIIISQNVYGGTFRVLDKVFDHFGIGYSIENTGDTEELEKKITDDVKAIMIESPANPLLSVTDIEKVAEIPITTKDLTIDGCLKKDVSTQERVQQFFAGKNDENSQWIRGGLMRLCANVLFVETGEGLYAPRYGAWQAPVFEALGGELAARIGLARGRIGTIAPRVATIVRTCPRAACPYA